MKQNIILAIYCALVYLSIKYASELIYQYGVMEGVKKRDAELDKLGKKLTTKEVVEYPFLKKESSNATDSTTPAETAK